jgi:hypothetical protein
MIVNPSLSHVAVQLNLENSKDILIIEYGQYLTKESDFTELSGSYISSNEPNRHYNENIYYYINKDGVRITIIKYEKLTSMFDVELNEERLSFFVSKIIACQYYKLSWNEYLKKSFELLFNNSFIPIPSHIHFNSVDCDIQNKLSVKELIESLKGEKWTAKKYNVITHNCQWFSREVIKILKAVRKKEYDKIRIVEKDKIPSIISSQLWRNEKLSITNTLGRIPIFGFFHDIVVQAKVEENSNH